MALTIEAINPHDGCYEVVLVENGRRGTEIGNVWVTDTGWVFESDASWEGYIEAATKQEALKLAFDAYITEVNK